MKTGTASPWGVAPSTSHFMIGTFRTVTRRDQVTYALTSDGTLLHWNMSGLAWRF